MSVKHGHSWEANSRSDNWEIHLLSWNQRVHYRFNKSPPLNPILHQEEEPNMFKIQEIFLIISWLDFVHRLCSKYS